ncbi:MAG: energy transducer TonB [Rhodospirillales bacterium]|nr:energy transducer TonB [Rhodospirillales bacterium]
MSQQALIQPARLSPVFLSGTLLAARASLRAGAEDRLAVEAPRAGGWPWRFAAMAGAAHLALAVLLVLAGRLYLPPSPPEPVSIQVVSETVPQGTSVAQPALPPQPHPSSAPAPQPLPEPPPPMPSLAPPAPRGPVAELPLPPPAAPPAPQVSSVPKPATPAAKGARIKALKTASVTVAVTHPAVPFADNQAPDYPQAAIDAGEQGVARFVLRLGADGRVQNFQLTQSSGYADLDANVRAAAMGWRYQPAMRNGIAVPSTVRFFVRFSPH